MNFSVARKYPDEILRKYPEEIIRKMINHEIELGHGILFKDWYGETTHFIKLTPYLWLLPFIVTVILLAVFKRAKLFGYTQKYLVAIMLLDLLCTLLTGIRDGALTFLKMDYGYIEYKICRFVLASFNLQTNLHGTSIWIKCFMSFSQYIIVAFPLKWKFWNLKPFFMIFAVIHLSFLSVSLVWGSGMPLKGVWTFQVPGKDHKSKIIQACTMDLNSGFYESFTFYFLQNYGRHFLYIYFLALPTISDIVLVILLTLLMRKQLKFLSVLAPETGKKGKIKYLILMKLNIILGLSFIVQEVPLFTYASFLLTSNDMSVLLDAQGIYNTIMTISFVIGKPLDLVIYASFSKTFRIEFSKLFYKCKIASEL